MMKRFLIPCLVVLAVCLVLVLASGSWLLGRKVIALLVLPVGMLWWVGIFFIALPGWSLRGRAVLAVAWLVFSLVGSPYVGIAALSSLEKPFRDFEHHDQKFDAVLLLGGGTYATPSGKPSLGAYGDRVVIPAMLFHEGKVGHLIATGRSVTEQGEDRWLGRDTSEIWQRLQVPESAIIELNEPTNTSGELKAFSQLLAQHPEWQRVGLCTSAFHMRRAMREAERLGMKLVPVPANFRTKPLPLSPLFLIPQSRGFHDVQSTLWEYLGTLF